MANGNLMCGQSECGELMDFFENLVVNNDLKASEAEFLEELVVIRQTNLNDWAKAHDN